MLFLAIPWTILFFLFRGNTPKSRALYHNRVQRLAQHYCRLILGLKYTIDNPLTIQIGNHPSIIVSNHQSHIDVMMLLSLSSKLVVIVKDYVWNNPVLHTIAKHMDCFPLSLPDDAKEVLIRRVSEEGYSILFFPEGTRTTSGEIGRFHRGAHYYSELLQLPIQPILLEGLCDYMTRKQFAIKPNNVVLRVLPEIPCSDTSFGNNYKRRTKSLEMHYDALMHMYHPSVGIIGAGVSGLFTGALLAQKGYQVTLLEQLPVFGGGLYSYERDGETWATGMHILSGMHPDGPITQILESLGITADIEETTMDNNPSDLIGEKECEQNQQYIYRFVGGSQKLANDLALYITRHGGRILSSQCVHSIKADDKEFIVNDIFRFDKIISTLHPKQLLKITGLPLFRNITRNRILNTPETFGSFKAYIRLRPNTLAYDHVTHFIEEHKMLVMTPCSVHNQVYARTIETVMPLDYIELTPWHTNRKEHYDEYEEYKHHKEQETLKVIETLYPNIREKIEGIFSSTSLTYRDDYLSPEGAMYGMKESVGSVRTRVQGFYLSGQNIFLHGLCGAVMTAQQTVQALCDDSE